MWFCLHNNYNTPIVLKHIILKRRMHIYGHHAALAGDFSLDLLFLLDPFVCSTTKKRWLWEDYLLQSADWFN